MPPRGLRLAAAHAAPRIGMPAENFVPLTHSVPYKRGRRAGRGRERREGGWLEREAREGGAPQHFLLTFSALLFSVTRCLIRKRVVYIRNYAYYR